jgi:hypothetical protein
VALKQPVQQQTRPNPPSSAPAVAIKPTSTNNPTSANKPTTSANNPSSTNKPTSTTAPVVASTRSVPLSTPPTTFIFDQSNNNSDNKNRIVEARVAADPLVIVDKKGNVRDGWEVFGASAQQKEGSQARFKKQHNKEERQRKRNQSKEGKNQRLDEDKTLFMQSLDKTMLQMVVVPDEVCFVCCFVLFVCLIWLFQ